MGNQGWLIELTNASDDERDEVVGFALGCLDDVHDCRQKEEGSEDHSRDLRRVVS